MIHGGYTETRMNEALHLVFPRNGFDWNIIHTVLFIDMCHVLMCEEMLYMYALHMKGPCISLHMGEEEVRGNPLTFLLADWCHMVTTFLTSQ